MTTESSPRANLRAAIAACDSAKEDVQRAEELLRSANEKLAELLAEWGKFDTLDDQISRARAARTIAAIEKGERAPTEEPSGFASQLTKRESVEAELNSVRQAIPVLESQLASAKHVAEQGRYEIELAVERVLICEAEELAERYVAQLREVREQLYVLRFLGARHILRDPSQRRASTAPTYWGNEASRIVAMPQSVVEACQNDCLGSSEFKEGLRKRDSVSAAVSAYFAALHSDPNAQLEIAELPPAFDPDLLLAKVKAEMAKSA